MRTRRRAPLQERLPATPKIEPLIKHMQRSAAPNIKAAKLGLTSPTATEILGTIPSDVHSPSPAKSKHSKTSRPIQSTPLDLQRRKRLLSSKPINTPRRGKQDENYIPPPKAKPAVSSRAFSPLPPSSPPSYFRGSTSDARPFYRHFDEEIDDDNKENIDTEGFVVPSSLVHREDSDPFGFLALERKLKMMRSHRLTNQQRPLLSGGGSSSKSKGKEATRRVPFGALSPRSVLDASAPISEIPVDEHDINDLYADSDDDVDKENMAPTGPLPTAAPLIPRPALVPTSSTSEVPDPLRTPHKRRRTYSNTPSASSSSSPSPSPSPDKSALHAAKHVAPLIPHRPDASEPDHANSPVPKATAESKRKRGAEEEIDPMAYSRNLEKLLPRRPAKRPAPSKGKGKGRARAVEAGSEEEEEATEVEEEEVQEKKRGGRGRARAARGRGRGRATGRAAPTTRVTRSKAKGKGKAKDEEEIDVDEDEAKAKERQARIEYFRKLDKDYSIEKEDVYII